MRRVFCDGRVVRLSDGWGLECVGLQTPAKLINGLNGAVVPDLTAFEGSIVSVNGALEAAQGNVELPRVHLVDIYRGEAEAPLSPLWAVLSGNLGNPPEMNPKGDRWVGSLAFMTNPTAGDEGTSWVRLTTYPHFSVSDDFQTLPKGEPVLVHGYIESYTYNDKARMQLAVRGLDRLPRAAGNAPKPPEVIFRAGGGADIQADSFTDAA